ncbi:MAG: hypothetical protein JWQ23_4397 [Herminiimonas sp.]|nr:hypothetical protein [Herminiimonas sp.]
MKTSEVIVELNRLLAEHGDLETLYECKEGLFEIEALEVNQVEFLNVKERAGSIPKPAVVIS